jgi:hypothetical protein
MNEKGTLDIARRVRAFDTRPGHPGLYDVQRDRKPGHVGAVAFSRTGDPATSDFGDATVIRKFGDVPEDLSAL